MPDVITVVVGEISSVPYLYSYKAIVYMACRYYGVFSVIKGHHGRPVQHESTTCYGASQPRVDPRKWWSKVQTRQRKSAGARPLISDRRVLLDGNPPGSERRCQQQQSPLSSSLNPGFAVPQRWVRNIQTLQGQRYPLLSACLANRHFS